MDELKIEVPVHDDPDWMSNSPFSPGKDRLESYEGKLKKTGSYYRLAERCARARRTRGAARRAPVCSRPFSRYDACRAQ